MNTLICVLEGKTKELIFNVLEGDGSLEIMAEALPYRYKEPDRVLSLVRPDETIAKMNRVGMILRTSNDKADFLTLPGKHIADFPQIDFKPFDNVYFYLTARKKWYFLHDGVPVQIDKVITNWRTFTNVFKTGINLLTKVVMK